MRAARILFAFALSLAATACAAEAPPRGKIPSMLIVNDSQYQLVELRIHRSADYSTTPNMVTSAIDLSAELVYYGEGTHWVTVFREKYAMGPILAFTTATPIELMRQRGYRLHVFDESFRLESEAYLDPKEVDLPILGQPGD